MENGWNHIGTKQNGGNQDPVVQTLGEPRSFSQAAWEAPTQRPTGNKTKSRRLQLIKPMCQRAESTASLLFPLCLPHPGRHRGACSSHVSTQNSPKCCPPKENSSLPERPTTGLDVGGDCTQRQGRKRKKKSLCQEETALMCSIPGYIISSSCLSQPHTAPGEKPTTERCSARRPVLR